MCACMYVCLYACLRARTCMLCRRGKCMTANLSEHRTSVSAIRCPSGLGLNANVLAQFAREVERVANDKARSHAIKSILQWLSAHLARGFTYALANRQSTRRHTDNHFCNARSTRPTRLFRMRVRVRARMRVRVRARVNGYMSALFSRMTARLRVHAQHANGCVRVFGLSNVRFHSRQSD